MDFEQSPEQENNDLGVNENTQGSETSTEQPDLTDLDSVDRFRFAGREWTRDELQKSILMQNDYTRKTQEISETRKYYEHLQSDLPKVLRDPSRLLFFQVSDIRVKLFRVYLFE
jgi:GTP-dependent phosphoenolpyruvate carboxykinase